MNLNKFAELCVWLDRKVEMKQWKRNERWGCNLRRKLISKWNGRISKHIQRFRWSCLLGIFRFIFHFFRLLLNPFIIFTQAVFRYSWYDGVDGIANTTSGNIVMLNFQFFRCLWYLKIHETNAKHLFSVFLLLALPLWLTHSLSHSSRDVSKWVHSLFG